MHGQGKYTWIDGRTYEGEYMMDKKEGYGVYAWQDGRRYEGQWKNGKQHGEGKYIGKDGIPRKGIWENGKRLKWVEEYTSPQQDDTEINNDEKQQSQLPQNS